MFQDVWKFDFGIWKVRKLCSKGMQNIADRVNPQIGFFRSIGPEDDLDVETLLVSEQSQP